jgi:hypothetical protein
MQHFGKSKIGSLSARKGVKYPQLRLPQQCADVIGDTAEIFETESDGKRAFLIVTDQTMPKDDYVLKQNADILKQCAGVAHTSPDVLSTCAPDLTEPLEAEARPESSQKPLLSIPGVVSCAASSGYCACACPGSVAAYHGALSRLRLGFKSRLGRFFFA